jgi:hypothetical protein
MPEALTDSDLLITGEPDAERPEAEWAALLLLLLADRDRARRAWRQSGPPQFAGLIDATAYETNADVPPQPPVWWWLVERQRYGIGSRRMVTDSAVRASVDEYIAAQGEIVRRSTSALLAGVITLAQWQQIQRDVMIDTRLVVAAVASGGIERVTDDDLSLIALALAYQFVRNQAFARDLADDRYRDADPVLRRAGWYIDDARQQYEASRVRAHVAAGYEQAINVLDARSESCVDGTPDVPDCVSLTEAGWMPIEKMVPPGQRRCGFNCRCFLDFRRAGN